MEQRLSDAHTQHAQNVTRIWLSILPHELELNIIYLIIQKKMQEITQNSQKDTSRHDYLWPVPSCTIIKPTHYIIQTYSHTGPFYVQKMLTHKCNPTSK